MINNSVGDMTQPCFALLPMLMGSMYFPPCFSVAIQVKYIGSFIMYIILADISYNLRILYICYLLTMSKAGFLDLDESNIYFTLPF
jgi:hypothetical protein